MRVCVTIVAAFVYISGGRGRLPACGVAMLAAGYAPPHLSRARIGARLISSLDLVRRVSPPPCRRPCRDLWLAAAATPAALGDGTGDHGVTLSELVVRFGDGWEHDFSSGDGAHNRGAPLAYPAEWLARVGCVM
jgi:hypothetical protein